MAEKPQSTRPDSFKESNSGEVNYMNDEDKKTEGTEEKPAEESKTEEAAK